MYIFVKTEKQVDELFTLLESRGVKIVKRPQKTFFGAYRGYVADIEDNLWEISTNPYVEVDEQGNIIKHKDIKHLEQCR
jgi:uncharacterized glyoxalase superfamily protein PhnB